MSLLLTHHRSPTFLVSQLARQQVTVALSGDGGDELFAGYNRHVWAPRVWSKIGGLPLILRKIMARAMEYLSPAQWNQIFSLLANAVPGLLNHRQPGYKLQKLAEVLRACDPEDMYVILTSHWHVPEVLLSGISQPVAKPKLPTVMGDLPGFTEFIMLADLLTYLPNDILTKVDRASMAVSLEARVPLLDHRVVEFAWSLPQTMKIKQGKSKWILRKVLSRYIPEKLFDRPKSGFGVPIENWLRGPLREWAEELLDESRLQQEGFFNPAPIRRAWQEHLSGKRNRAYHLWDVLMFQAWLEKYGATA